jgi:hypothetical protein
VVLGTGDSENGRRMTAQITGRVECSVLIVPAVGRIPGRRLAGTSRHAAG